MSIEAAMSRISQIQAMLSAGIAPDPVIVPLRPPSGRRSRAGRMP